MAVSLKALEKAGVTEDKLKVIFEKADADQDEKVLKLIRLISDRVQDGRNRNYADARLWYAIDAAYDVPFDQTTPTLVQHVMSKDLTAKQVLEEVAKWGLRKTDCLAPAVAIGAGVASDGDGGLWSRREPTFFNVKIPAVNSYVGSRWARLFNERNLRPFLKYSPKNYTDKERVQCEALTDVIETVSEDMDYPGTGRQAIFQSQMYSRSLVFPQEPWHKEIQLNDDGEEIVVREGIRYLLPHPRSVSYDLRYPLRTFNNGTGCEFALFWKIERFGSIFNDTRYWNRSKIPVGIGNGILPWWEDGVPANFWQEIYPCSMQWPTELYSAWTRNTDRDAEAAWYTTNEADKAVFMANVFMKVRPSDYGLGDYKYPVWFRFIVATDRTVIWAQPFAYDPVMYCGYNADDQRAKNVSLALQLIPWQDILGNQTSQMLLSGKQNLANVVLWDSAVIGGGTINVLENAGERLLRGINFVEFNSLELRNGQANAKEAFFPFRFPLHNIQEIINSLSTIINLMERMVGISAQETGQAASHEQSAEEMRVIYGATTSGLAFSGSFIDDFLQAMKVQNYEGARAYMDEDFEASISSDVPNLEEVLKEIGISPKDDIDKANLKPSSKIVVKGKLSDLTLQSFTIDREGPNRLKEPQLGAAMMQAIAPLTPILDPQSLIDWILQAVRFAGVPVDLKLAVNKALLKGPEEAQQQQQQQDLNAVIEQLGKADQEHGQAIQQLGQAFQKMGPEIAKQTLGIVDEKVAAPVAQAIQQESAEQDQMKQQLDQLTQLVLKLEQMVAPQQQAQPPMPPQPQFMVPAGNMVP